jgi:MoaA/NifB/PqqE/SkfB family radical SAM enzyme
MHGIGEPLLNQELPSMIQLLKERGVYVLFNTNAILLTRRRQESLIASGLDELRVSIDGSTPETYLRVRGVPAFDRVVEHVGQMVQTKKELGAASPRVSFWVTGMRENLPELPGVIELAGRIGVDEVYLQRMVFSSIGMAVEEQSIYRGYREEAERIIDEAERLATRLGITFRGAGAISPREAIVDRVDDNPYPWQGCSRPLRLAYVTANGNALPCCIAPFTGVEYDSIILGNYLKDGVEAVWHGQTYQQFRQALYSPNPMSACRNCGVQWSL